MKVNEFMELASEAASLAGIQAKFVPFQFGDGIQIISITKQRDGGNDLDRFLIEITSLADSYNYSLQLALEFNDYRLKTEFMRFGFIPMGNLHQLHMERVPQHGEFLQHEFELQDELTNESVNFRKYLFLVEKKKKI